MRKSISLVVCAVCASALLADVAVLEYEVPAAEEAAFDLDTLAPHKAAGAVSLPYAEGATLTATAPDGTPSTLVSAAVSDGTYSWTGAAGGVWTLANSLEGETTFTVRYSAATRGAGTVADPAKIMDEDEIVDIGAGAGYVFTPCGGDWLLAALELPAGCALTALDGNCYRLDSSADGYAYGTVGVDFQLDTVQEGPDRIVRHGAVLPFAYSGDDWAGSTTAESTLTFTAPAGIDSPDPVACAGHGAYAAPFRFKAGVWTVTLEGVSVTPITGHLDFIAEGTRIFLR